MSKTPLIAHQRITQNRHPAWRYSLTPRCGNSRDSRLLTLFDVVVVGFDVATNSADVRAIPARTRNGHERSCDKSGRSDSNRRRPAWEAGILPLNYARTRNALQLYELTAWGQSISIRLNTPRVLLAPFGHIRIPSFLPALATLMLSTHLAHRGTCGPCQQDGGVLLIAGRSQAYSTDMNSNGTFDPFDHGALLGKWVPCSYCAPALPLANVLLPTIGTLQVRACFGRRIATRKHDCSGWPGGPESMRPDSIQEADSSMRISAVRRASKTRLTEPRHNALGIPLPCRVRLGHQCGPSGAPNGSPAGRE